MALLEAKDILKTLPHRFPMLLVDRILECDEKRVVGLKNLTANEPFFQGHFPGYPVMPGVLQIEAIAQVGGILVNRMMNVNGQIAYFLAIDNARFRRPCVPGDQLIIEVVFTRARLGMSKMHGKVTVNGEIACEADIMFAYKTE